MVAFVYFSHDSLIWADFPGGDSTFCLFHVISVEIAQQSFYKNIHFEENAITKVGDSFSLFLRAQ